MLLSPIKYNTNFSNDNLLRNDRSGHIRAIVVDVTCNEKLVTLARSTTTVALHVFNESKHWVAAITKTSPSALNGIVSGIFQPELLDASTNRGLVARIEIQVTTQTTEYDSNDITFIVIALSQKSPPTMLGQIAVPQRPALVTSLKAEVLSSVLSKKSKDHQSVEIVLGTFDPDPDQFISPRLEKGSTEIVAVLARAFKAFPVLEDLDSIQRNGWSLIPIRKLRPLALPKKIIDECAKAVSDAIDPTYPYGEPLLLEDVLKEILNLEQQNLEKSNSDEHDESSISQTSSPTRQVWPVSNDLQKGESESYEGQERKSTTKLLKKHSWQNKQTASPPSSKKDLSETTIETVSQLKQQADDLRNDERRLATELYSLIDFLKRDSVDFAKTSEKIFAEPWKKNTSKKKFNKHKTKHGGMSQSYTGNDDIESSGSSNSSTTSHTSIIQKELIDNLRKELRAELVDTLQQYATKDSIQPMQSIYEFSTQQLTAVHRDLQLIMQKQSDLEATIHGIASSNKFLTGAINKNYPVSETKDSTTNANLIGVKDPFVRDFIEFTRGIESITQVTGESFRRLQQALHYPEAFKELAMGTTYPCARKILEFISSDKATALVEDIETLAGVWRAAGTDIPSDKFTLGSYDVRDFSRKSWWTLRPFDYS